MHRRNWQRWVVSGAVIVVIAVVAVVLLSGKESLRGKVVKVDGSTVTLQDQDGLTKTVKLANAEGLTVGTQVEIDNYSADAMTGDKAHIVPQ
jgi:hypothetical protein